MPDPQSLRRFLLPFLSLIGIGIALSVVGRDIQPPLVTKPMAEPASAPFAFYISGAGIVEAASRNIGVATPISGVITEVPIRAGDRVAAGSVLFRLDGRDLQAQLVVRQAAVLSAQAKVAEAAAQLADYQNQLYLAEGITDRRAISVEELAKRRFAVQLYEAKQRSAQADLVQTRAQVDETRANLDRLVVRAPVAGQVLQVNIRPGEYAQAGEHTTPLMMLGETDELAVRIDIDENDAWRYRPGAPARITLRGARNSAFDLKFRMIEPYVGAKKSLAGDSSERAGSRVLQVVYTFVNDGRIPVYVGQQVDAFLATAAPGSTQ